MYLMVTNNSLCEERFRENMEIEYLKDGTYFDVLKKARDYVQKGYFLETHPLAGSIKPNQTPYRTVVLSKGGADRERNYRDEVMIEDSIQALEKFLKNKALPDWPEQIRDDFKTVDYLLIEGIKDRL